MIHEIIISPADLSTQFAGEYDVITHQPYRIGDHIIRCRQCHTVIKTEYIDGECPLCGASPFVGTQFRPSNSNQSVNRRTERRPQINHVSAPAAITPRHRFRYNRSERLLSWLITISAILSPLPLWIDAIAEFICEAMFGMGYLAVYIIFAVASLIAALIIECRNDTTELWKHSLWGPVLIPLPAFCPYLLLAGVWIVIGGLSIVLAIAALMLCIAVVMGCFQIFD